METWIAVFLTGAGFLFIAKLVYVISAGSVLSKTKGALFVSTPGTMVKAFLDNVPMGPDDLLVDLGCGDGRVLRAAKKRYKVRTLGIEINPLAFLLGKILSIFVNGVVIRRGDFWKHDVSDATVIFCYLFPDVLVQLSEKLKRELRPGTVVASCNFPIAGWDTSMVIPARKDLNGDPLYIYRLPDI
ncbi:class I SAM-dependent methyltransferase [Thermodesulfobacteriota bacterium]